MFDGVDFAVEGGAALHVAGANGSGKTSLLRLLCGLSAPAAGEVRWNGARIASQRDEFHRNLIYVGHASAVKDDLTALENLIAAVQLAGGEVSEADAQDALERIGLGGREDLPAKVLSQGQRRRVVLARLLLGQRTPLWVLDEPFNALDRRAVEQLSETMEAHLQRGGMVVFTTHQDVLLGGGTIRRLDLDPRRC